MLTTNSKKLSKNLDAPTVIFFRNPRIQIEKRKLSKPNNWIRIKIDLNQHKEAEKSIWKTTANK